MGSGHSSKNESFDGSGKVNFDHFQILRAIGKGSFGKVCIVQKKDSKMMFAMKYMNKASCLQQEAVSNVIREVDILKKVEHAFLVNVWYCFQDEEDMFMVNDCILFPEITTSLLYRLLQLWRFLSFCIQANVSEIDVTLETLRLKYLIHRDIKPDNILLDEEGHVHITDFNIATELAEGEVATSLSGTKPYMAPEVFSTAIGDCPGYSFAVDWWALGVTLFELLKKRRPFSIHSESNPQETRHTIYNTKLHFPGHVSEELNDLLRQLLHVDPKQRMQSAHTVQNHSAMAAVDFEKVKVKAIKPLFVPSKDNLNCDPTYELEEMIIETKPLHKKKKRLAKQSSKKDSLTSDSLNRSLDTAPDLFKGFHYYNRELIINGKSPSGEDDEDENAEHNKDQVNVTAALNSSAQPTGSPGTTTDSRDNPSRNHQATSDGTVS
ncbi:serine/threonine-protein kinase 32B [Aplysia californica]|uniref:Serine/threonine-protein kinase 32B n=1 Tax=Aplysia californica TaxID=6500 RepID=A0ABM1AE69_APLCA|nr:serine/threonine-protein kinase 32B [Aplysia californica]